MRIRDTKRLFIDSVYGTEQAYRKARKDDYCACQLAWTIFMDGLVKNGFITDKQFHNATF